MARMFPENIDGYSKATKGEREVFRFLKEAARPQGEFLCWYEPSIGSSGSTPDYVLFGKKLGLVVFEVKDWRSHQIVGFNPHQFRLRVAGRVQTRTHPDRQAKGYVDALRAKLGSHSEFCSDDPRHLGRLKIPIGRMVVFPNISQEEYAQSKYKWLLDVDRVLFLEDISPSGEIRSDGSGRNFRSRISRCLPFHFNGMDPKQADKLSLLVWPEAEINLPQRQGSGKIGFDRKVQALDREQARVALRIGRGHQVIKGPPGSGKTLVLVHRCCHLLRLNPQTEQILLVCFNIALVSYLKRLLQEKGVGIGDGRVTVCHFFELCSRVLGEPVQFENEETEYYELVVRETLDKVADQRCAPQRYDAILVDEGQDFSNDMLKTLLFMLKPGADLVICMDEYQDVYRRRPSWKSIGIRASGRTTHLTQVYRNTSEIFGFTQNLIGETPKGDRQLALLPRHEVMHGEPPELRSFPGEKELYEFITADIQEAVDTETHGRSEIAIIYDDKVYGNDSFAYDNRALPMRLLKEMEQSGIPSVWVSQDVRSKEMYDMTTDRVSLISIHSSKGLDFNLVYLVGVDRMRVTPSNREALISLLYVAMTRARYRLVIPYVRETELIARIKECTRSRRRK